MTEGKTYITLLELNLIIRNAIERHLEPSYWVVGEISEISEARSGHCYLELVDKKQESDQPQAKSRAAIWAATYRMLKPFFEKSTGQKLEAGIKILVRVNVRFHEQYGLSLTITDIEPAFTLGDLEMKRQQAIKKLKEEGIFDLNTQLELEPVTRYIAVISSPTAAGYGDFINQLNANSQGFRFTTVLFPAYMQGNDAVASMINAMEKVYKHASLFNALVIIRGGGSRSELACFDSYELASHICQFPLPVLSGIGHERDVSVADMVSHSRFKTPTATAQFLIDNMHNSLLKVENLTDSIYNFAEEMIDNESVFLKEIASKIFSASRNVLRISAIYLQNSRYNLHKTSRYKISAFVSGINRSSVITGNATRKIIISETNKLKQRSVNIRPQYSRIMTDARLRIEMLQRINEASHPEKIIKKGFSVTRINGKTLKKVAEIIEGQQIETRLSDGTVLSNVQSISKQI